MKISTSHVFPCTPAEFFALLSDPEFEAMLTAESKMRREVLRNDVEGPHRTKVVRIHPNREIPDWLRKLTGPEGLSYDQTTLHDTSSARIDWHIHVPVAGDRVRIAGVTFIKPHPDGCERTLDGDIEIDVPVFGRRIEKHVLADVQRSYEKAAAAVVRWLEHKRT